ncbi:type II toxin-antitoxin system Phd/YefM family antitoxin [Amphritea pacifica]|uniref:type II toxin-antitoxin system Phd/YefM family antitoxin n=1 Tax=Amphritea pacifica TaxID=2811233 RepID=UPI0019666260|nr:type II toxin-antitoxin system prevent-host-death family antitoxin [Amphritea pacifica]MBN1009183.1 type II toxin-antitoxin system Phd/YefM family antitoxin [Amphritea pacifica]
MEVLNASDAKREFGELILKAQNAPVGINKNGKPVAVVVSAREYEQLRTLQQQALKAEIEAGLEDIKQGKVSSGSEVINRLRQKF